MNNFHRLALALFFLCFSALAVNAANCGDVAGPCSCGDTVVDSHTLTVADPIRNGVPCAGTGLYVVSNVTLDCTGLFQIIGPGNGVAGMGFYVTNAENITIKNCNLQRFRIGFYIANVSNVTVQASVSNTMNGSTAINMPVAGIYASNMNNSQIYGNAFTNLTKSKSNGGPVAGIMVAIPASNNSIHDNSIFNIAQNGSNGQNFGIYLGSSGSPAPVGLHTKNNSIYNNWMQNLSGINSIVGGILLMDGAGYVEDNLVQNNFVDNVNTTGSTYFAFGLYLHAANSSNNNFTLNNATNVYAGISSAAAAMAFGTANGTLVNQNILGLTNGTGIAIYSNASVNVTNNTVYNASFAGIAVSYGGSANTHGTNASITLNAISYCGKGIFLNGSDYDNVTDNTLSFLGSAGINVSNSNFDRIINNNLTNANSTYGIVLADTSRNSVIHGNTVTSCSLYCIYLDASIYDNLTSNNVSSSYDIGIYLYDSSYNNVSYNTVFNNSQHTFDLRYSATKTTLLYNGVGYNDSMYFLYNGNQLYNWTPNNPYVYPPTPYNCTQTLSVALYTNQTSNQNVTAYFNNASITNCATFEAWMLDSYGTAVTCAYYNVMAWDYDSAQGCYWQAVLPITSDVTGMGIWAIDDHAGMSLWESHDNNVTGNLLYYNGHTGISAGTVISQANVYNNHFKSNNLTSNEGGMELATDYAVLEDNFINGKIEGTGQEFGNGITVYSYSIVKNNYISLPGHCIQPGQWTNVTNNTIVNCDYGTSLWGNSYVLVENNSYEGGSDGILLSTGSNVGNATGNVFRYNNFTNMSGPAIRFYRPFGPIFLDSYALDNVFEYNTVTSCRRGVDLTEYGNPSQKNNFTNNVFQNNSDGVDVGDPYYHDNLFAFNNFTGNDIAVQLYNSSTQDFKNNIITGNRVSILAYLANGSNFYYNSITNTTGSLYYVSFSPVNDSPSAFPDLPYLQLFMDLAAPDQGAIFVQNNYADVSSVANGTANLSMALGNITAGGSDELNVSIFFPQNAGINDCSDVPFPPSMFTCKRIYPVAWIAHGAGNNYEWNSSMGVTVYPGAFPPSWPTPEDPPWLIAVSGNILLQHSSNLGFYGNTIGNSLMENIYFLNSSNNFFANNTISQPDYSVAGDLRLESNSTDNIFLNTTFNKTSVVMLGGSGGTTSPSYYVSRAPLAYLGRNFSNVVEYDNAMGTTDIPSDYTDLSAAGVDGTFDLNVSLVNFTGGPFTDVNMTIYYDPALNWNCSWIESNICPAQFGTCNCWYNGTAFHANGAGNNYTWNLDPAGPTIITPNTYPAFLNYTALSGGAGGGQNNITVQWYLDVLVENYTFFPLQNSNVTINDTNGTLFADNETTGADGRIGYRVVTEYTQNSSQYYGVNATMFIPFNFTAATPPLTAYIANTTLYNVTYSRIYPIFLYSTNPDVVLTAITPDPNKILLYDENVSFAITVFNGGGDPFQSISVHVNLSNSGAHFDCPIFPIERFKSKTIMCGYTQANVTAINVTATVDAFIGEINTANNYRSIIVNAYNQKVQSGLPDTNLFVAVLAALAAAMLLSRRNSKTKK